MRTNDATTRAKWQKTMIDGALVLLGLAWFALQEGRAQLEYNGGFVQTHRDDRSVSSLAAPQYKPPSAYPSTPPSYFPDKDNNFYYSSYYYSGGESGRSVSSATGRHPFDISAAILPWNQVGFKDYPDLLEAPRDSSLYSPRTSSLEAIPLPQAPPTEKPSAAMLIAHLPEHAILWIEGRQTRSRGRTRYFESPPLQPGRKYSYTVRAAWIEEGRWVSQTQMVPVRAGLIQALYLRLR